MRFIKKLKKGYGSILIELVEFIIDGESKYVVLKHFKTKNKYEKEIMYYELLHEETYTPNIVYKDSINNVLGIEYCGESINLQVKRKDRYKYKPRIREIVKELKDKYGIYHNDIRWKNTCLLDNNIYIIDWERARYENIENDDDFILTDRENKDMM